MDLEEHSDEPTAFAPIEGPPPGTVLLDKYRVDFMLGIGGYGYVVKAHHLELGESVAIKILRDDRETDPQTLRRFKREAQLVIKLKSEHVARVLDVGKLATGGPYMIMELLEGEDLGKTLERGPLQITRAVDYILQTCDALAEAHGLGIVHRDIKPGNLFLAKLPARPPSIKVLDFGISKSARRNEDSMRLTQTQSILGTPAYMSPEQMRDPRNVDVRSDIWSLGAVLYELVEGELPFDADNFAELVINVSTNDPRGMMLAPELRPVIERCLAKRMDERFQNVAELAQALAPFATPALAREYVGRAYQLLGHERPTDEELAQMLERDTATPPRAFARAPTPLPAPTQVVDPLPAIDHFPTMRDRPKQRRRFPWLVMLLVAIVTSSVTVVVLLFVVRGDPKPETADKPIVTPDAALAKPAEDAATTAVKVDDHKEVVGDGSGSAKAGTGSGSAAKITKVGVGSAKPPRIVPKVGSGFVVKAGSGSATVKVGPGSAKSSAYCPDGSLVANHPNGCPKR